MLVFGAAACTSTTGRSAKTNVDDTAITAAVKTKLAADRTASLTQIDVDTVSGTVYLTGVAPTSAAKSHASDLADDVDGVIRVVNNLQIKSAAGDAPWDKND
jgi:hyperosmotically inducible protein